MLHCRHKITEPRPRVTCTENLVMFRRFDMCFSRATLASAGISCCVSVCPSVRSVRHKSVFCTETAKRRITQITPHDSLGTLVTARRNARIVSAVLATAIPSVRPSVCPSHAGIVSKRRHVARCSLHCWIAKMCLVL